MWIARDKNGKLHMFYTKPELEEWKYGDYWKSSFDDKEIFKYDMVYEYHPIGGPLSKEGSSGFIELNPVLYPEVTFENSPVELKIC